MSIRSHSRKWPWRDWQPLYCVGCEDLFVCVGARDSCVASYWIDTLVLKNWGKYLRCFTASPFPLQGKPTQCSRGSKKDFWRRCWRVYAKVNIPSTHHKPLSPALHYLPFASRFPLPPIHRCRFIRPVSLSSLSFSICPFLSACLFVCLCVSLLVCRDGSR